MKYKQFGNVIESEVYGYVNQIRSRARLSTLTGLEKASFRTAVLKEGRVELAFENHRWYDLKRTMSSTELVTLLTAHGQMEKSNPKTPRGGIPFNPEDYVFEAYEALFPIPYSEILINKVLTQNPGYK